VTPSVAALQGDATVKSYWTTVKRLAQWPLQCSLGRPRCCCWHNNVCAAFSANYR